MKYALAIAQLTLWLGMFLAARAVITATVGHSGPVLFVKGRNAKLLKCRAGGHSDNAMDKARARA